MVLEQHSKNRADNNAEKRGIEEKLAKNYGLRPLFFVCGHVGRSVFSAEWANLDSLQ
jgi:hypothetical protein